MNIIERIRADVNGARILADWVGDGGEPVAPTIAGSRFNLCRDCPSLSYDHTFEHQLAKAIAEQMKIANEFGIGAGPKSQASCSVCNCYLPLKIWVPWKHLKNFTDPAKFPQNCWIPKEATTEQVQQNSTNESGRNQPT